MRLLVWMAIHSVGRASQGQIHQLCVQYDAAVSARHIRFYVARESGDVVRGFNPLTILQNPHAIH